MNSLSLTSPVFEDGGRVPDRYAYKAKNVNPPLRVENVPEEAESLALVVDDPDAKEATGKVFDHWVVWNIPPDVEDIGESWAVEDAEEGANGLGESGFLGFNPPDREHTYQFRLYALDTTLELEPGASKGELEAAMTGHVLAEAHLEGTFAPSQVPEEES
jgi:hypothetical protein